MFLKHIQYSAKQVSAGAKYQRTSITYKFPINLSKKYFRIDYECPHCNKKIIICGLPGMVSWKGMTTENAKELKRNIFIGLVKVIPFPIVLFLVLVNMDFFKENLKIGTDSESQLIGLFIFSFWTALLALLCSGVADMFSSLSFQYSVEEFSNPTIKTPDQGWVEHAISKK